jgi:hypothetical protein
VSAIEKLSHLFARYDREKELFLEYVRREGQNQRIITDVVKREHDHSDESRPE